MVILDVNEIIQHLPHFHILSSTSNYSTYLNELTLVTNVFYGVHDIYLFANTYTEFGNTKNTFRFLNI